MNIAVLMTCYNRREKTLACLDALQKTSASSGDIQLSIYLTDDGCSDGTADAVDLSAADWVGGDDVLLAKRSIPAGGGTAADGTSWDDWLIQQGGDATYVDLDWSADRGWRGSGLILRRTCLSAEAVPRMYLPSMAVSTSASVWL